MEWQLLSWGIFILLLRSHVATFLFFFFNDTATTEIYTLSLHDALPIYDRHDDSDLRARAALTMLGVKPGWRVADIGCGNGVLACEAALMGAEVDAVDISPAMLALAKIQAGDRKVAIRTQSAGLLSFAYQPNSYDLIVSEFTLHHLPDFWKAVALSRIHNALKPGACFFL